MTTTLAQPRSPIIAQLDFISSLSIAGLWQLKNPGASGLDLYVWEFYLSAKLGDGIIRAMLTNSPTTLQAGSFTILTAVPQRLDERDTTAIVGELKSNNGPIGGEGGGDWDAEEVIWDMAVGLEFSGSALFRLKPVRPPGGYPIIIKPGAALEAQLANAAGNQGRGIVVWDEEVAS